MLKLQIDCCIILKQKKVHVYESFKKELALLSMLPAGTFNES